METEVDLFGLTVEELREYAAWWHSEALVWKAKAEALERGEQYYATHINRRVWMKRTGPFQFRDGDHS